MNTTTKTIPQLEDELQTIDSVIARERKDEQRGTTRFSRIPGLLAERDQLVHAIQLAREPQDQALEMAQAIIAMRTHDPIAIARYIRDSLAAERADALERMQHLQAEYDVAWREARQLVEVRAELERLRAAPVGWRIEDAGDSVKITRLSDGNHCYWMKTSVHHSDDWIHNLTVECLEALSAAPSAPAPAAQEPVGYCSALSMKMLREGSAFSVPVNPAAFREPGADECALYTAPPAAEQPDTVKVPRDLADLIAYALHGTGWFVLHRKLRALLGKEKS